MEKPVAGRLARKRILVVEEIPVVALDIVETLREAGAEPVGPVHTEEAALALVRSGEIDAAVLDIDLVRERAAQAAQALAAAAIPTLFTTTAAPANIPVAYLGEACLLKPIDMVSMVFKLARLLESADPFGSPEDDADVKTPYQPPTALP